MPKPDPASATFDELLASAEAESAQIARRLREIIFDVDPDSVEVIYLGYDSASYGIGPKKNSEAYCYIMPQKDRVNLGFYYGVALSDPEEMLEGTGKMLRHVKIRTLEDAEDNQLRALIQDALSERQNSLKR